MMVWVASSILAWTGASSFAELGSAIPQDGGAQAYLSYAYGPLVSYLFAWTSIIALNPGGNAVISLIFSEYLNRIFWHSTRVEVSPDDIPQWVIKLTAVGAVVVVTILCVATRKLGTQVAVVFTTVKVTSLVLITVFGIVRLATGKASSSFREPLFRGSSTSPSSYALALYSGLWAFDGWNQANFVAGEIRQPEKNIPRVIHSSMIIVTLLFLLANLSYFVVLDKDLVGLSNTVAMDFGRALFGPMAGSLFAFMVAFSCFGALNGSFYTSSRLICAAGRERYLPAIFGRLHTTRHTPLNAALLQAAIAIAFILIGNGFRSLINFSVVASWSFYFLTVLGLVILRIKEPTLERPYKTWIITPLIFCGVALFLLCMPIIAAPREAGAVLGFVVIGIPIYYLTQAEDKRRRSRVTSWFSNLLARLQRRPRAADGWEAVATEGEETAEISQIRR
jgi:amino acid transporter